MAMNCEHVDKRWSRDGGHAVRPENAVCWDCLLTSIRHTEKPRIVKHDDDPETCWHDFEEIETPSTAADILAVALWGGLLVVVVIGPWL